MTCVECPFRIERSFFLSDLCGHPAVRDPVTGRPVCSVRAMRGTVGDDLIRYAPFCNGDFLTPRFGSAIPLCIEEPPR